MPDTDITIHVALYRAIRIKRWYIHATRRVNPVAFELRSNEDKLSVLKAVNCSKAQCDSGLRECYGEFILPSEGVIRLGLRVLDDDSDDPEYSENHPALTVFQDPALKL